MHSTAESKEDKKTYERFLESALEWYPRQVEVFDRATELSKVAGELGDIDVVRLALDNRVLTAQWFLKHPKALRDEEYSKGDLYEVLGDAYGELGKEAEAKAAYSKGADEYLKALKASAKSTGLDENTERGNNLERFYCLWKSGKIDEADALYEKFEKLYPEEFTFYFQHARMLKEAKRFKDGEDKARLALRYSYGDNHLRVVAVLAEILQAAGDKKQALDALNAVLDHSSLPDDKTIRTHRYYNKLIELKEKLK